MRQMAGPLLEGTTPLPRDKMQEQYRWGMGTPTQFPMAPNKNPDIKFQPQHVPENNRFLTKDLER